MSSKKVAERTPLAATAKPLSNVAVRSALYLPALANSKLKQLLAEALRRDVFTIVIEFKGANDNNYVQKHHHNAKHFMWTAMANDRKKSPAPIHA